jgi:O-acetyl-ADP-ribose deacetylase (regulator of RNase III)
VVQFVTGNLLDANVDALVNTVNTKGVMGKGIALQFRRAFPENYDVYRAACEAGGVRLGHMLVVETGRLGHPRLIINFPTKGHWKSRSRLTDIEVACATCAACSRSTTSSRWRCRRWAAVSAA